MNLVETMGLSRYPWPTVIKYDWGLEFYVHEVKNTLIQREYIIKARNYARESDI